MSDRSETRIYCKVNLYLGTCLWIAGVVVWWFTRSAEVDGVPYTAIMTIIVCLALGSAMVNNVPVFKRIEKLEEQVKVLEREGDK